PFSIPFNKKVLLVKTKKKTNPFHYVINCFVSIALTYYANRNEYDLSSNFLYYITRIKESKSQKTSLQH
ncbi:MAG: hypothetical protein P9X22_08195, partial [Candidatus Zapsychrus exili]|nr:hypothetical protein [Candidatus Zapsychrus exili]